MTISATVSSSLIHDVNIPMCQPVIRHNLLEGTAGSCLSLSYFFLALLLKETSETIYPAPVGCQTLVPFLSKRRSCWPSEKAPGRSLPGCHRRRAATPPRRPHTPWPSPAGDAGSTRGQTGPFPGDWGTLCPPTLAADAVALPNFRRPHRSQACAQPALSPGFVGLPFFWEKTLSREDMKSRVETE